MVHEKSGKHSTRLETLRRASRNACKHILKRRADIIAIYVVGSVARGNIHEKSDVDMMALIEHGNNSERESLNELGCNVDIFYVPLKLWKEGLYHTWGSEWEVEVSSVVDSLTLHDPSMLIKKIKKEFRSYPEDRRWKNIRLIHDRMTGLSEAVWYHYMNRNYDFESIFSKLYAMEALRILFPLNKVYLRSDKLIFKQVEELPEEPSRYLQKCLSLLRFKSRKVNHNEANWIINSVSETKKAIEDEVRSKRPDAIG